MAGLLTRDAMVSEVLDTLGRTGTAQTESGTTLADRCITWLNRAQIEISRKEDFLFNIATATTVASQKDYSFPDNVRSLISIRLEDGLNSRKLTCVMPWEFDKKVPKPNEITTGVPSVYVPYRSTDNFELYRIPDNAYTMRIRYSYWPNSLSESSSTSSYSYMDDVLIYWSISYGFGWMGEMQDAAYWKKRGDLVFTEAKAAERDRYRDWMPVQEGFDSTPDFVLGEYYNNPFASADPSRYPIN